MSSMCGPGQDRGIRFGSVSHWVGHSSSRYFFVMTCIVTIQSRLCKALSFSSMISLYWPVSSKISDLRNFWLHIMCACTEWYYTYQIRPEKWWL